MIGSLADSERNMPSKFKVYQQLVHSGTSYRIAEPRWTTTLNAGVYGTPVVAGGLLFLTSREGMPAQHTTLLALDLATREVRWRCRLENSLVNDPTLAHDDALYIATRSADPLGVGLLLALDASTGDERWRWTPGAQAVSAAAPADGTLYVTLDGDQFWAVDAGTGDEGWHLCLPMPRSVAAPAASPDHPGWLFLPSRGPHLCAVDVAQREIAWHHPSPDDAGSWFLKTPALAGGRLFAASTGGAVLALDAKTGERLWRTVPGQAGKALTAPTTDGQRVYVGGRDHCVYALDAGSGETLWRRETARRIEGRPLLLDGTLYVTGHDHCLRALDAPTGIELWHVELSRRIEGGPAVSGDLVLTADRGGNVSAVERVLTAEDYAAQERWLEAAAAYARWGDLATAAQVYEERMNEPFHAAELWQAADRLDRAAPLYRQAGAEDKAQAAYRQAIRQAAAAGDYLKAGDSSTAIESWDEAGELYERAGRPDLAGPALEKAALTARAAECYRQAGLWAEAARLYEQMEAWPQAAECHERAGNLEQAGHLYEKTEAWPQAAECHERAGNWEQAGHLYEQMGHFEAAVRAFIQAAHNLEEAAPHEKSSLAKLWTAAEACCRETFDEVQAEACRRQVACYRGLPHLDVEIVPPDRMVRQRYALLRFTVHNVGGGEAQKIVVHHTPSEFMGELSDTREIRGLSPGQKLQQFLSVRPLASGPVPLVIAIDYSDAAGDLYETTYRTRLTVLEPHEPPAPSPQTPALTAVFADFDLLIGRQRGDVYPVHVVRSPGGGARGDFCLPFTPQELADAWQKLEDNEADEDWMQNFGARLFTALFQGQVGSRFRSSQGMVAQGKGLRLRLRAESGDLIALPWELLYDPERREFLSLTRRAPVVRHLRVAHPTVARPISPPLQMLVVPASPRDLVPLEVQAEVEALQGAVQPLVEEELLAWKVLQPPTVQALREHLVDHPCHILHFIGHGGFDGEEGYLALEGAQRRTKRLDARELKVLFSNTPVRLAVLNACLTARDAVHPTSGVNSHQRAYLGVAPALVDAGLLAVVAMQFSLGDKGAQIFAQDFYRMLARRRPVDEAVDQARVAMMLELGLECRDWVAPVLFLRGSTGELFS